MKVAVIHQCGGCSVEGRSHPDGLPDGWSELQILRTSITLCERCTEKADRPESATELTEFLRGLLAEPHVGDEVILLVDGFRGKFKGERAIVASKSGKNNYGIRVPGKVAPGETEEYVGPYFRNQFRLLREPPSPAEAS